MRYDGDPPSPNKVQLDKQSLEEYLDIARWTGDLCLAQLTHARKRRVALQGQPETVSLEERSKARALRAHARIAFDTAAGAESTMEELENDADLLRTVLHHHTVEEAERGTCDAVLLSFVFGEGEKDKNDLSLLLGHLSRTASNLITLKPPPAPRSASSPEESHADQYKAYYKAPDKMDCPASRTETDNDSITKHKPAEKGGLPQGDALCIPRLVVETKKPSDSNRQKSLNQCRVYCIASVQFFAHLGVYYYPVFGAAIDGKFCYVLMAWADEKGVRVPRPRRLSPRYLTPTQTTFMFDREVRKFDITVPIQALQYMTFLLRLKREADAGRADLTNKVLAHFRASRNQPEVQTRRSWTKAAQAKEFPQFHTPPPPPPPKEPMQTHDDLSSTKGMALTV